MGYGLFDFAADHPDIKEAEIDRAAAEASARDYKRSQGKGELIKAKKENIKEMLKQEHDAQYILFVALETIAEITDDLEWGSHTQELLNNQYGDLSQLSIGLTEHAEDMSRLRDRKAQYVEGARRRLKYVQNQATTINNMAHAMEHCLSKLEDLPDYIDENGNEVLDPRKQTEATKTARF